MPRGTEPAWTGGADQFQLRVDRSIERMRAHFVNSTGTTTALGRARALARRGAAAAKRLLGQTGGSGSDSAARLNIIERGEWGGDTLPPKSLPQYGAVKLAFVHHTVGTNDYGPEDSAAIVLAVAKFHRSVNGWSDIGYNLLVDKYGQVFEGRAGGIERAVVGAQAAGFNSVSTGVANLGTFSSVEQSEAGLNALSALIAWKLALHGAPVIGKVTANGKTFDRISGHRDANATECPGDALYGELPRIRSLASSGGGLPSPGSLTLEATPRRTVAGQVAALSGMLSLANGDAPDNRNIDLQALGSKGYRTIARRQTGAGGRWSVQLKRSRSARVRARYRDPSSGRHVYSPSVRLAVAPAITATVSQRRVRTPATIQLTGATNPRKQSIEALIERRGSNGSFSRIATIKGRARRGRFRLTVRLSRTGLYRITARTPSDPRNASGSARPLTVRATTRRRRSRARR